MRAVRLSITGPNATANYAPWNVTQWVANHYNAIPLNFAHYNTGIGISDAIYPGAGLVRFSGQFWLPYGAMDWGNYVVKVWKNSKSLEVGTGIATDVKGFPGSRNIVLVCEDVATDADSYQVEFFTNHPEVCMDAHPAHTFLCVSV